MVEIGKNKLIELSHAKLRDAKLLRAAGSSGNAYYLAGYATELMLKAILSSQFKADTLPDRTLSKDVFTHDLAKLAKLSHLEDDLSVRKDLDGDFVGYWQTVLKWSESSRYDEYGMDDATVNRSS
jgi:hypothetical protein